MQSQSITRTLTISAVAFGFCCVTASGAFAKTELTIEYAYPSLFNPVHQAIIEKFQQVEPDIEVKIRTKYDSYEDGTQKILREAMTKNLPDISFQGLSRVRVLVEKGIAQPLDAFIDQEKNFGAKGFYDAMYKTVTFDNKVYGLPFAVSLPISFFNMDLARKAGYTEETLPKTWDEVYEFGKKVEAAQSGSRGFFYYWGETGFWQLQALLFEEGGSFMNADEKKVTLNTPQGYKSFGILRDMVTKGNMKKDYDWTPAMTDFYGGKLGLLICSSSILNNAQKSSGGRFAIKTAFFPGLHDGSTLPAGGNAAVMTATDPEKQKAAWKLMKFWSGVEGAKVVGTKTGYMAPNKNAGPALQSYFADHPQAVTVYKQQPYMTGWYAFPGKNGLKITELIYDALEKTVTTDENTKELVDGLNKKVQRLIPRH